MKKATLAALAAVFILAAVLPLQAQNELASIQKAIEAGGKQWTAGENTVTILPPEGRRRLLGSRQVNHQLAKSRLIELPPMDLPAALDWRNRDGHDWVTPVKDQGQCGSCWAFSACGQVESWWMILQGSTDVIPDVSEQYVIQAAGAGDCDGGNVGGALNFFITNGVYPEAFMPYEADDDVVIPANEEQYADQITQIPDWGYITLEEINVEAIKRALMHHPVSASYDVYGDFYYYNGGVYEHIAGELDGGHAIVIVGWNDADKCWICKNSWGPTWGENGYFRIRWGDSNMGTYMPFVYDNHSQAADISLSESQLSVNISRGEQKSGTVFIQNNSDETISYSVIDDMIPMKFTVTDFKAFEGRSIWCGDADLGGYDDHWLQYLDLPVLDLSATQAPILSLNANWYIEEPSPHEEGGIQYDGWDGWNIWVSVDGGAHFQVLDVANYAYTSSNMWAFSNPDQGWDLGPDIPGWGGSSSGWKFLNANLGRFKQSQVVIRFAFASDMATCTADDDSLFGLLLDNISIDDGSQNYFYSDGESLDGMQISGDGSGGAPWLDIEESVGVVEPHSQLAVNYHLDASGLDDMVYSGRIRFQFSDDSSPEIVLPISMTVTTAVEENNGRPVAFALLPNYPNPFNGGTKLGMTLPTAASVKVEVFDVYGREVCKLYDGLAAAGRHEIDWQPTDSVPSGVYICRMTAAGHVFTRKMLYVK